ncbi:uncharacterized protein N7458_001324 [Penicillium daleae]|uniref:Rhodopsin domain-containing protein n=1 Tax=Penicillium daleae TaxID=63821 RepID=A0AAD6G629_9EURO|nr:uncharacterized protein N7458_001324 [Penicillium daleae]KAJ5459772.1 hypothetical protein N7458_001324 [Penicillium daleae]
MRVLPITTIFTILATLFVTVRLWTRFRIVKSPGYDDLLIFFALICSIALYAFILLERHYGLGKHKKYLSDEVIQGQLHYLWLSIPFYNLSLVLAKLSILVLFIRIFRSRKFLIYTYTTMAFLIIAGLWMVFSGFLFCIPVSDFWKLDRVSRHCLPEGPVWYANAAMQIITDVVILVLPMPLLSKLHLPRRQKVGTMLVFGVGIFVIATSSARLYELTEMIESRDFTKRNSAAAVWSCLEANVSIICACLAPLHPLISRIFSFCFRPQRLNSSPATKTHSTIATNFTSSRKHSIYDPTSPDGGIFYNDFFVSGPGLYTTSISRTNTNEDETHREGEGEDGIRVVRELRMVSDTVEPGGLGGGFDGSRPLDRDFEMEMGVRRGSVATKGSGVNGVGNTSTEWDLGDWEFPDYKERMNAPI